MQKIKDYNEDLFKVVYTPDIITQDGGKWDRDDFNKYYNNSIIKTFIEKTNIFNKDLHTDINIFSKNLY